MGIATIASYRAAQLFEIVGIDADVVKLCFRDTHNRVGGVGFARLDTEARELGARGVERAAQAGDRRPAQKYMHGGEYHMFNPDVVMSLQKATRTGEQADWQAYADIVNHRPPSALRDLCSR